MLAVAHRAAQAEPPLHRRAARRAVVVVRLANASRRTASSVRMAAVDRHAHVESPAAAASAPRAAIATPSASPSSRRTADDRQPVRPGARDLAPLLEMARRPDADALAGERNEKPGAPRDPCRPRQHQRHDRRHETERNAPARDRRTSAGCVRPGRSATGARPSDAGDGVHHSRRRDVVDARRALRQRRS